MSGNLQEDFEAKLHELSREFENSFLRHLNQLRQRVQEQFEEYERKIHVLQTELNDREKKIVEMQWKHDIEQKEMMDKLKKK